MVLFSSHDNDYSSFLSLWTVRLQVIFGLPHSSFSSSVQVIASFNVTVLVLVGLNSQLLKLQYNYDSHTFI